MKMLQLIGLIALFMFANFVWAEDKPNIVVIMTEIKVTETLVPMVG